MTVEDIEQRNALVVFEWFKAATDARRKQQTFSMRKSAAAEDAQQLATLLSKNDADIDWGDVRSQYQQIAFDDLQRAAEEAREAGNVLAIAERCKPPISIRLDSVSFSLSFPTPHAPRAAQESYRWRRACEYTRI